MKLCIFHSRNFHPDIIKFSIYPTEDTTRLKLTLEFALKFSYMFRLTNHHQGAYCCVLLKLCLLKQSVKIRHYKINFVLYRCTSLLTQHVTYYRSPNSLILHSTLHKHTRYLRYSGS